MLIKDSAICLRTVDYSDTSQIVTLLSRGSGKISAIARGAKRAGSSFDGAIDIFSCGQIVFSQKPDSGMVTLTEFHQSSELSELGENLFFLNCAMFAVELTGLLTDEHDPHPALFEALMRFLENCRCRPDKSHSLRLLVIFQLTLLNEVGLRPVLNRCLGCSRDFSEGGKNIYFSSSANGLICRDCESAYPDRIGMSKSAAKCLCEIKTINQADENTLLEMERILVGHFTELLGRRLKMARYILPD